MILIKAFCKMNDGTLQFCTLEEPNVIEPDDVKIKVMYNTICSDEMRMDQEGDYFSRPRVLGHEMAGEIVELGKWAEQEGFAIGDRVSGIPMQFCGKCRFCRRQKEHYCNDFKITTGTMCEYVVWKYRQIVKLDRYTPYKLGCLVEPISAALEAIERVNISFGDSVAIFGAGCTGLFLLQLARMQGASEITVVEPIEYRRDLAKMMGADYVVDFYDKRFQTKMSQITDFNGFDVVIETSSNTDTLDVALNLLARGGILLLFTYYGVKQKLSVNTLNLYINNQSIYSSFLANPQKLEMAVKMLPMLRLHELPIVEFSFKNAVAAFEAQKSGMYTKIAVKHY